MKLVDLYPNWGAETDQQTAAQASGSSNTDIPDTGSLPALWWLGILLALIGLRVLYELAEPN